MVSSDRGSISLREYYFVTADMNNFSAEPDQTDGIALENCEFVRNNPRIEYGTQSASEGNGIATIGSN
jgi:hypothetical protein